MTTETAIFLEANFKDVAANIATKIENSLDGDFIDMHFYLTEGCEVDYCLRGGSETILTITAQSQEFYKSDCEGYVVVEGIEDELQMNIARILY